MPSQEVPLQQGARPAPQTSLSLWQVQAPLSQPKPEQQSLLPVQACAWSAQHAPSLQVVPSQQSAAAPQLCAFRTQPQVEPSLHTRPGQQFSPPAQVSPDIEQTIPSSSWLNFAAGEEHPTAVSTATNISEPRAAMVIF